MSQGHETLRGPVARVFFSRRLRLGASHRRHSSRYIVARVYKRPRSASNCRLFAPYGPRVGESACTLYSEPGFCRVRQRDTRSSRTRTETRCPGRRTLLVPLLVSIMGASLSWHLARNNQSRQFWRVRSLEKHHRWTRKRLLGVKRQKLIS